MRRAPVWSCLASLALAIGSCRDASGPKEDPGTLLGTEAPIHAWIPGTSRLAYFAAAYTTGNYPRRTYPLKLVDIVTGSVQTLDTVAVMGMPAFGTNLVAAPDGSALYYVAGVGSSIQPDYVLREVRLAGAGARTLRTCGSCDMLVVSPDGRFLAIRSSDTLIVRELATGAEVSLGAGRPVVFSPSGAELLHRPLVAAGPSAYRVTSLADGSSRDVDLGVADTLAELIRWDSGGLRVLFVDLQNRTLCIRDVASGRVTEVATVDYPEHRQPGHSAWSREGQRVAFWLGTLSPGPRGLWHAWLYTADASGRGATLVAQSNGVGGPVSFSPDGARLAYHIDWFLYTRQRP